MPFHPCCRHRRALQPRAPPRHRLGALRARRAGTITPTRARASCPTARCAATYSARDQPAARGTPCPSTAARRPGGSRAAAAPAAATGTTTAMTTATAVAARPVKPHAPHAPLTQPPVAAAAAAALPAAAHVARRHQHVPPRRGRQRWPAGREAPTRRRAQRA